MRASHGSAAALGALLLLALSGCEATNLGLPPPGERFFFPSGVLLDPVTRVEPFACESGLPPESLDLPGPRYLYVANGNNDRSFNTGTLVAIDLQAFWRAWYDPHRDDPAQAECLRARREDPANACAVCEARDPRRGGVDPYCHVVETADGPMERCVDPRGATTEVGLVAANALDASVLRLLPTPQHPCRRLPLSPQVAECDEAAFVVDAVHVGDFATTLAYSLEDDGLRLWLPVRGDPSLTYVDVVSSGGEIELRCDQGDDPLDPDACGGTHKLDALRGDPDDPIGREPFNVAVWEHDPAAASAADRGPRLAFVAHSAGSQLTLVDLDGVPGSAAPEIVDLAPVYVTPGGSTGGYGLAVRPCFAAEQGPLGALDPLPNVPVITQGCTRPLVYTSFRYAGQLASFTASGLELPAPTAGRDGCEVDGAYAGPYCAPPDELDQPCAVECEPQVRSSRRIQPALIDPFNPASGSAPVLGAMAFADPRGDQLLVLQTNPGALLSVDTSLGEGGEPVDVPSAPPVEVCAEPSSMKIYTERTEEGLPSQRYAIISCFRAALVYVVDLEALRVVDAVVVGTGPHDIAIDEDREVAYVINNLESSISVVDLSRRRATRFQELARLGLQDPFTQ